MLFSGDYGVVSLILEEHRLRCLLTNESGAHVHLVCRIMHGHVMSIPASQQLLSLYAFAKSKQTVCLRLVKGVYKVSLEGHDVTQPLQVLER